MPRAAIAGDMTACPLVDGEKGHGLVPHVGGSLEKVAPPVMAISGEPSAITLGDLAHCETGAIDVVVEGSATVLLAGLPVARQGDATSHTGFIVDGSGTVDIGGPTFRLPFDRYPDPADHVSLFVRTAWLSPTLAEQLEQLEREGWTFRFGDPGGGSFADRGGLEVVIDPNQPPDRWLNALGHEAGHAVYELEDYVPPDGLTLEEFIDANLEHNLRDEAIAWFNDMTVRREIQDAGGPDQRFDGVFLAWEVGAVSYETALDIIAQGFAEGITSTTGETYAEFYGSFYEEIWNAANS